jgi:hypothetical protein
MQGLTGRKVRQREPSLISRAVQDNACFSHIPCWRHVARRTREDVRRAFNLIACSYGVIVIVSDPPGNLQ